MKMSNFFKARKAKTGVIVKQVGMSSSAVRAAPVQSAYAQSTRITNTPRNVRSAVDSESWTRTQVTKNRLSSHPDYKVINGVAYFKDRPVLGRDMNVNGTVYTGAVSSGASPRESVVTDRKYGRLNELFGKAKQKISAEGNLNEGKVIKAVFDVVSEAFPVKDNAAVEKLIKEKGVQQDGKIALDIFIDKGVGVCRHNALATADLLQHFIEEGVLKGRASVDRNTKPVNIDGRTYEAGHAWCRYTAPNGDVLIIDPMHGKIKKLKEIDEQDWDYRRPND